MNYAQLRTMDISDGDGIRVALYVSGCNFHCLNCYNKQEQNFAYGKPYTQKTEKQILSYLSKPYIAGLSLLGGDPLWQDYEGLHQLQQLCKKVHKLGKNIWIWSGFTWEEIFPEIVTNDLNRHKIMQQILIEECDIWVDGRYIDSLKDLTLKWRGSSNQRVIDIKQSITTNSIVTLQ